MNQRPRTKNDERRTNGDVVVSVKNVSKKFCKNLKRSMAYGIVDLSKNLMGIKPNSTGLRKDEFWAVKDISFELRRGEVLGLIGINGSGKTTLLRLLTGLFPLDKGEIAIKGKVGALIAVGAGFHPHMTGLENIYLNGAILGMSREEIDSKFQEIVDFADIGNFLDAPSSTYSSGMRIRLGFSIAIQLKPDVLLVDEILAVGDIRFQRKCFEQIRKLIKTEKTGVIIVSHNMLIIETISSRMALMDKGKLLFIGDTQEGITKYNKLILQNTKSVSSPTTKHVFDILIVKTTLLNQHGENVDTFFPMDSMKIIMEYESAINLKKPILACRVWRDDGLEIFVERSSHYKFQLGEIRVGRGEIVIELTPIQLKLGLYRFGITIYDGDKSPFVPFGTNRKCIFNIIDDRALGPDRGGLFNPFVKWHKIENQK